MRQISFIISKIVRITMQPSRKRMQDNRNDNDNAKPVVKLPASQGERSNRVKVEVRVVTVDSLAQRWHDKRLAKNANLKGLAVKRSEHQSRTRRQHYVRFFFRTSDKKVLKLYVTMEAPDCCGRSLVKSRRCVSVGPRNRNTRTKIPGLRRCEEFVLIVTTSCWRITFIKRASTNDDGAGYRTVNLNRMRRAYFRRRDTRRFFASPPTSGPSGPEAEATQ